MYEILEEDEELDEDFQIKNAIQKYNNTTKKMDIVLGKPLYFAGKEFGKIRIDSLSTKTLEYLDSAQHAGIMTVELKMTDPDHTLKFSSLSRNYKKEILVPVKKVSALVTCDCTTTEHNNAAISNFIFI